MNYNNDSNNKHNDQGNDTIIIIIYGKQNSFTWIILEKYKVKCHIKPFNPPTVNATEFL